MPRFARRPLIAALGVALLGALAAVNGGVAAFAGSAAPVADRTSAMVRADALPTAQIDGVAWAQAVVGNVVFVGGSFTTARPAGAAPGTSTTPRSNLLAYNLTTGELITGFAPNVNGPVRALSASPDGTRLYVGGQFTSIDGQAHYRLAAFDVASMSLVSSFTASTDATVNALAATNSTVYAGGVFSSAGKAARSKLAAFDSSGRVTSWNPGANSTVLALTMTPDGTRVIAGGKFTTLAGVASPGSGSVDATTGAAQPWAVNQTVRNSGTTAAVYSLSHDGSLVYGTGYNYKGSQRSGQLEGAFAADPTTGKVVWIEACHGDTYSSFSNGAALYTVSHAHDCTWINAFGAKTGYHYALAFSLDATQTDLPDTTRGSTYSSFGGQPAPSIIDWFPDFTSGTFTGLDQAAWTVSGNSTYVVAGGEFTKVNGVAQQGLVRFSTAAGAQGPQYSGAKFMATSTSSTSTSATVTFTANTDRDDRVLTYTLLRSGTPVATMTAASTFWNRPTLTLTDSTGLQPGTRYGYRLMATDSDGNVVKGDTTYITTR